MHRSTPYLHFLLCFHPRFTWCTSTPCVCGSWRPQTTWATTSTTTTPTTKTTTSTIATSTNCSCSPCRKSALDEKSSQTTTLMYRPCCTCWLVVNMCPRTPCRSLRYLQLSESRQIAYQRYQRMPCTILSMPFIEISMCKHKHMQPTAARWYVRQPDTR